MEKYTARDAILDVLSTAKNRWFVTNDFATRLAEKAELSHKVASNRIYTTVSKMSQDKVIDVRKPTKGLGLEYKFKGEEPEIAGPYSPLNARPKVPKPIALPPQPVTPKPATQTGPQATQPATPVPTPTPPNLNASPTLDQMVGHVMAAFKEMVVSILIDPRVVEAWSHDPVQITQSEEIKAIMTPNIRAFKAPKHNPEPPSSETKRPPKVMIYGLHVSYRQKLLNEYSELAEIRFGDPREPGFTLKQRTAYMDKVYVMKDHVGHSLTDTLKNENIPIVLVSGSLNGLRSNLDSFLKDRDDPHTSH